MRDAQKEKIEQREELLKIRAEREKVALRMDAVRIKHEHDSKVTQVRTYAYIPPSSDDTDVVKESMALNAAVHDVELAVERGRAYAQKQSVKGEEAVGIEFLLKTVADEASSAGAGGVLRRVQEFNAFLERAAVALEGRS